jgi:hypothetical protein
MNFGNMYFGQTEFDLVDQEPERLRQVAGIGAKRAVVGSFFPPPVPSPSQYPLPVARVRGIIQREVYNDRDRDPSGRRIPV